MISNNSLTFINWNWQEIFNLPYYQTCKNESNNFWSPLGTVIVIYIEVEWKKKYWQESVKNLVYFNKTLLVLYNTQIHYLSFGWLHVVNALK